MKFRLTPEKQKGKVYYSYKATYYEKGTIKSKRVYLGNEKEGLKIVSDFNTKKPDEEALLSYSGETLLKDISKRLNFSKIINNIVKKETKWNIGEFIESLVIERCLKPYSKWALAKKHYSRSVLSFDGKISSEAFHVSNIYNYMDYIVPHIHQIQSKLNEQVNKLIPISNEVLLLDGTSIYTYGKDNPISLDEIEDTDNKESNEPFNSGNNNIGIQSNVNNINRVNGYSRDKRFDLPQVNLMLGVNQQAIPLYFECFSGNESDFKMFEMTLKRLNSDYSTLMKRLKKKYLIFDRGNLSSDNMDKLENFCKVWDLGFIGGVKSSMFKQHLKEFESKELPLIYKQNKTKLYGKIIKEKVFNGNIFNVLLYTSKSLRDIKINKLNAKIKKVLSLLDEVVVSSKFSSSQKVLEMKKILSKHSMVQLFWLRKFNKDGNPIGNLVSPLVSYELLKPKMEKKLLSLPSKKQKSYKIKLKNVQNLLQAIDNDSTISSTQKSEKILSVLRKHSMMRLFYVKKFDADGKPLSKERPPSQLYELLNDKVEERKSLLGKFVIISNNLELSAIDLIKYYMSKEVVEHEFHLLKSVLDIRPINHILSTRITAHIALVNWGMLLLSVLRLLLSENNLYYSFEELLDCIQQGYIQRAIYHYPKNKSFLIHQPINITEDLTKIFNLLAIPERNFHIEKVPPRN